MLLVEDREVALEHRPVLQRCCEKMLIRATGENTVLTFQRMSLGKKLRPQGIRQQRLSTVRPVG